MRKILKSRWFHIALQILLQILNKKCGLEVSPEMLALPTALYVAGKTVTDCVEARYRKDLM